MVVSYVHFSQEVLPFSFRSEWLVAHCVPTTGSGCNWLSTFRSDCGDRLIFSLLSEEPRCDVFVNQLWRRVDRRHHAELLLNLFNNELVDDVRGKKPPHSYMLFCLNHFFSTFSFLFCYCWEICDVYFRTATTKPSMISGKYHRKSKERLLCLQWSQNSLYHIKIKKKKHKKI